MLVFHETLSPSEFRCLSGQRKWGSEYSAPHFIARLMLYPRAISRYFSTHPEVWRRLQKVLEVLKSSRVLGKDLTAVDHNCLTIDETGAVTGEVCDCLANIFGRSE